MLNFYNDKFFKILQSILITSIIACLIYNIWLWREANLLMQQAEKLTKEINRSKEKIRLLQTDQEKALNQINIFKNLAKQFSKKDSDQIIKVFNSVKQYNLKIISFYEQNKLVANNINNLELSLAISGTYKNILLWLEALNKLKFKFVIKNYILKKQDKDSHLLFKITLNIHQVLNIDEYI